MSFFRTSRSLIGSPLTQKASAIPFSFTFFPWMKILYSLLLYSLIAASFSLASLAVGKSFMKYFLKSSFLDLIFSQMISESSFSRSSWIWAGSPSTQQAVAILFRL